MKNLNEFSKELFAKKSKYERRKQTLYDRMEKAKTEYRRLKKPMPEDIIKPLAVAIQKELKAKAYYVIDIDSFYSTVTIHWVTEADMAKCKNKDHIAKLEIHVSTYDKKVTIVEKDEYDREQYIDIHKNKGVKWLAKYAKQKFLNEGKYGH